MTLDIFEERRLNAQAFISQLTQLQGDNYSRREMAALKRNAGNTLAEARGVGWFYRLLDSDGRKFPEIYFLVATLWALNPHPSAGNFGHSCHLLWLQKKSPSDGEKEKVNSSVARRFNILLDAGMEGGELAFRLRQCVKLLASQEVGIDWAQFLCDLLAWSWTGKRVQREWALSFYAPNFSEESTPILDGAASADMVQGDSHVD